VSLFQKYPEEVDDFDFDFRKHPRILNGDTVASAVVTSSLVSGNGSITLGDPVVDGSRVQFQISGGADGDIHLVKCLATTMQGETLEGLAKLYVKNDFDND